MTDHEEAKSFIELARQAIEKNDLAGAEKILRHAIELDPENTEANYLLGKLYEMDGDQVNAAKQYERATLKRPLESDTVN